MRVVFGINDSCYHFQYICAILVRLSLFANKLQPMLLELLVAHVSNVLIHRSVPLSVLFPVCKIFIVRHFVDTIVHVLSFLRKIIGIIGSLSAPSYVNVNINATYYTMVWAETSSGVYYNTITGGSSIVIPSVLKGSIITLRSNGSASPSASGGVSHYYTSDNLYIYDRMYVPITLYIFSVPSSSSSTIGYIYV